MPAKLSIGLSRKVGEANYGSRGASINLEIELDSMSLAEPALLRENVRKLYAMARRGVEEELSIEDTSVDQVQSFGADATRGINGQSHVPSHGNQPHGSPPSPDRGQLNRDRGTLTASQHRAIFAIARRQQVDPKQLIQERFQLEHIEDLSIRQASELIDLLKSRANGVAR